LAQRILKFSALHSGLKTIVKDAHRSILPNYVE
jgi:hypothetical protein